MAAFSTGCSSSTDPTIDSPRRFSAPHLQIEIPLLLQAPLSENTQKTYAYQTGLQAYYEFSHSAQYNIWPPTSDSVVQFVAYLSVKGLSYATVRSYLGVSYYTKLQGHQDLTNHFLVCKFLQGLKRMKHTKDTRLPITKQLLQDIILKLPMVCFNDYEPMLYSAAFNIAFY